MQVLQKVLNMPEYPGGYRTKYFVKNTRRDPARKHFGKFYPKHSYNYILYGEFNLMMAQSGPFSKVRIWQGCICKCYAEFRICLIMALYASIMPEYASVYLNVPQYA